ncbi:hypothetical protein M885DRAFT_76570 [Pelagophyceae sp. CCMP2097]|nr:hypothetical protein M885DRAFT_76570 [Pelagophyceae sp. CCMP2097]
MEAMIKGRQVHLRRIARRAPRGRVDGQKYGVAVVTGGLRGLGAVVGRYLLDAGLAESVVVVGRTPQAAAGHGVRAVVADVSDWDSVLERLPVKADLIVHCAGVLDDKLARYVDAASLASVLAPKVHGTANLLKRYPLAKVVAFSSSSAFLGPVGQATYSAANAYLDERLGRGAVQWGGWGGAGMAVDHSIEPLEGERFLALQDGLAIFRRLLEEAPDSPLKDGTPAIVLDIADWGAFGSKNPSLFGFADDGLVFDPAGRAAGGAPRGSAFDARTGRAGEHARVAAGVHVFRRLDFGKGLALQHVVQGSGVVPGTAYVCWALEALRALDEVPPSETLSTHAPTHVLRDVNFVRLWELADASSASASLTIDAHRGTVLVSSEDHVYATMSYRRFDAAKDSANDVRVSTDATIVDVSTVDAPYRTLGENGYAYGPAFSRLARVSRKSATLAEADVLSAKSDAADAASDAGVLDAVLQLASFIDYAGGGLPAVIEGFWWAASKGAGFASVARCAAVKVESGVYDVVLFGADGSVVGRANRFHLAPEGEAIKGMEWQMSSFTGGDDANDSKEDLEARRLSLEGIDVIRVDEASDVSEEMARIEACARRGPVVVCAAVGSDTLVGCALDAGVAILQGGSLKATREVLRSVALDHEDDSEAGAGHERSGTAKAQKRASRYVARVSDDDDAGVGIFFEEDEARALGPRDVELQVQMWSLSFRDVLLAKGLMSSDVGGTALGLGCECSGIVVRAGSEARFEEGTLVTCLPQSADSTMGSHLIADDSTCFLGGAADSEGCDALAASTMCYGTAWYGLVDRARIRAGDRVLIHSAAGGVGLAAVHLCLKRKCVVYGTASTPEKRDYLLSLGVSAVFDSRTICDFVTGVEKLGGCDVVLNSLSGDAIPASLALLSQGGHFVELGKRDAHADATLPQKAFLKGLS